MDLSRKLSATLTRVLLLVAVVGGGLLLGPLASGASATTTPSWQVSATYPGSARLAGVAYPTTSDCTAVGYLFGAAGTTGAILTTTDGGTTWTEEAVPSGVGSIDGIACPSTSSCTAVGPENDATNADPADEAALILATTNGRVTWTSESYPSGLGLRGNGELLAVGCVTSGQCWAVEQGSTTCVILMNAAT